MVAVWLKDPITAVPVTVREDTFIGAKNGRDASKCRCAVCPAEASPATNVTSGVDTGCHVNEAEYDTRVVPKGATDSTASSTSRNGIQALLRSPQFRSYGKLLFLDFGRNVDNNSGMGGASGYACRFPVVTASTVSPSSLLPSIRFLPRSPG